MMDNLEACLPEHLRGPGTTIAPMASGLSRAGVFRVTVGDQIFVLKVSARDEQLAEFVQKPAWQRKLDVQQVASRAGLAPRIIHVDHARRAVVSAFVADQSFVGYIG